MIISKTPLRITLGGGGTDLPSYYEKHNGGFLISAAIDKYIFVSLNQNFSENILLKYSKIEDVKNIDEIQHPIIRESLRLFNISHSIEISTMADIPAGTGLGSSGAFTVGLLTTLFAYKGQKPNKESIAKLACQIEIDILKEPIGKQDQFISALGGLRSIEFRNDGSVNTNPILIPENLLSQLQDNLILFFTGIKRSASEELFGLDKGVSEDNQGYSENLHTIKANGYASLKLIESGNFRGLAKKFNEQWQLKYERSPSKIHDEINEIIRIGLNSGAEGGKLIGAGGGGFIMFYTENKAKLRTKMASLGLREVHFKFDFDGSCLIE